ncbi:MAG: alpha/beta hydrolase [Desulfobacteraceae bacterium]|nr:MAG: alpha/beta hydrolase [Desulfobacteraceae bacterium]
MFLKIQNTDIHVTKPQLTGTEKKPALLFIHGAGNNAELWQHQTDWFKGRHPVYCLDLPGHGLSKGPGETEITAYTEWTRQVIAKAFFGRPLVLTGHSMGGAVTQELAADPPPEIKGLILIGTGAKLGVVPEILTMLAQNPEAFFQSIDMAAFDPETPARLRQPVIAAIRRCDPAVILGDFRACDRFDIRERLKEIHLPTLILCGKRDKLTPVKYSHYLHEHIRNSELALFDQAGHMVMVEQAEQVNHAIQRFIINKF